MLVLIIEVSCCLCLHLEISLNCHFDLKLLPSSVVSDWFGCVILGEWIWCLGNLQGCLWSVHSMLIVDVGFFFCIV